MAKSSTAKTRKRSKSTDSESFVELWNDEDILELKTELDLGIRLRNTDLRSTIHSSDDDQFYFD